ncbi:MAG: hypothetical protein ACHP9Z_11775 [Streptosporangiales bacterium]
MTRAPSPASSDLAAPTPVLAADPASARLAYQDGVARGDLLAQWPPQQRHASDILTKIIRRRRTLTPEMRDLADFRQLSL